MKKWNFKKNGKHTSIYVTEEAQPEVLICNFPHDTHLALISIAEYFEPGDIITTPENGGTIMSPIGMLNN